MRQIALLLVFADVESRRPGCAHVDPDPVHPLARSPRAPDQIEMFQGADRTRDGGPAGQQRISQLRDALLARLADRQVAEQPAYHWRHAVAAGIETTSVV